LIIAASLLPARLAWERYVASGSLARRKLDLLFPPLSPAKRSA